MPEGSDIPTRDKQNSITYDFVYARVWEAIRNQIIERTAIRENNQITLSLEPRQGLLNSQMVLCIDYNYELRSLLSRSVPFELQHDLHDHIECAKYNLPKFECVEIGSTKYSGSKLQEKIKNGVFSVNLTLEPGYEGSIPVCTKCREVIYVPGSFNLVMRELCAGVTINLNRIPAGLTAYVRGPHASIPVPLDAGATLNNFQEEILLPGQGFEFRFTPKVAAASTAPLFTRHPPPVRGYFLEIESPTAGENVQDGGCIKGTAYLPPDAFLWIFVGGSATFGWWRSLGNGVHVKGNLAWEVPALYGRAADTGTFEILAIVVDQRTHEHLLVSYARAGIAGKSMDLPRPIDDSLVKTIAVEKPAIQLDRFNVERRGAVLAVKQDRRVRSDRRNMKAS